MEPKDKKIDLPPSGLPADMSSLGTSGVQQSRSSKPMGAPIYPWKALLIGGAMVVGITLYGATLPKSGTPDDAIATQYAAMTSQALAKTDSPPTSTIAPTKTVTPYPDITMTPTATHTADEEEASLKMLPAVNSVEFVERRGTDYWAGVTVWPKFNKESFAQLLLGQAIKVDLYTFRFAVRIDDGESEPLWWVYTEELQWVSSSTPPAWVDLE